MKNYLIAIMLLPQMCIAGPVSDEIGDSVYFESANEDRLKVTSREYEIRDGIPLGVRTLGIAPGKYIHNGESHIFSKGDIIELRDDYSVLECSLISIKHDSAQANCEYRYYGRSFDGSEFKEEKFKYNIEYNKQKPPIKN